MKRGCFITIEGGEGAGKSSAMVFIREFLVARGIEIVITREPGGTEIAEKIRAIILNHHQEQMDPMTELLLYFASRAQHLARTIVPALADGKWVVSDRFTDASFAYQGAGRGISAQKIQLLEKMVQGELQPDLTLLFDVGVEVGMERVKNGRELDRLEIEKIDFYERVRKCYLQRAQQEPKRFRIVDAGRRKKDVLRELQKIIEAFLEARE